MPTHARTQVLRGVFLLRRKELDFFYEGRGTNFLFPEQACNRMCCSRHRMCCSLQPYVLQTSLQYVLWAAAVGRVGRNCMWHTTRAVTVDQPPPPPAQWADYKAAIPEAEHEGGFIQAHPYNSSHGHSHSHGP